jgi:O-antigen/teichoic acid export membrane protein
MVKQIGESRRDTKYVQFINFFATFLTFIVIKSLIINNYGSPKNFYGVSSIIMVIFSAIYLHRSFRMYPIPRTLKDSYKSIYQEYKQYCKPLITMLFISTFAVYIDLWLLNTFWGADQQGYFFLAKKYTAIIIVITTSIIQVLWKEVAEASELKQYNKVKIIYVRYLKIIYYVICVFSMFLIPYSREVINITVGNDYTKAIVPFSIFLLYPLQQTIGQVNGVIFYANGYTKTLAKIGIITSIVGLLSSASIIYAKKYLIFLDQNGAATIALKTVIVGIITANLSSYFLANKLGIKFAWLYQYTYIAVLIPLAYLSKFLSILILPISLENDIVTIIIGFFIYLLFVTITLFGYNKCRREPFDIRKGLTTIMKTNQNSIYKTKHAH